MEKIGPGDSDALTALLEVHSQRKDLQEAFPEAGSGDYQRLLNWAIGVAGKRWDDGSFASLKEHRDWYFQTAAFKIWNCPEESLTSVERRIHDGVPLERLHERAYGYIKMLGSTFPWAIPPRDATILEIGSGVGHVMEAAAEQLHPARVIGLDIAPAMIEKAKQRFARDDVGIPSEFLLYDGINIPMANQSVDFIYSVACLQHVPKPYVYNLFGEMLRILKPTGTATLHFLSFSMLKLRQRAFDLKQEIARQLKGGEGHWHHFYTGEELTQVLTYGYGAQRVTVVESGESLWAAFIPAAGGAIDKLD